MKSTKDKLKDLDRGIKKKWESIDSTQGISTKAKLEKLVQLQMRRHSAKEAAEKEIQPAEWENAAEEKQAVVVTDFYYPLDSAYRRVKLREWYGVNAAGLALLANNPGFTAVDPLRMVFFDTETTGLAGGTGTVPFMLGFGFIHEDSFHTCIFLLTDLAHEAELLDQVDAFLQEGNFSALVTFNGKAFDMPLLEARCILQRRRCPLSGLPHLDFLFPARSLWRHTYDSRKLGFLAESLLGISRTDDIEASDIPALYFNYLRTRLFSLMKPIIGHNALDLLSLSATLLLALRYLQDYSLATDEGEILGLATIYERAGLLDRAGDLYRVVKESAVRQDVLTSGIKRLALLLKKQKLFQEAIGLWQILADAHHHLGFRELSVHYEHREKNLGLALEVVRMAVNSSDLPERIHRDMEKRLQRLCRKIERLEKEGKEPDEEA